jgi:hypothetical protein
MPIYTLVRGPEAPSCARCASSELEKKLSVFASPGSHPGGPGSCALN